MNAGGKTSTVPGISVRPPDQHRPRRLLPAHRRRPVSHSRSPVRPHLSQHPRLGQLEASLPPYRRRLLPHRPLPHRMVHFPHPLHRISPIACSLSPTALPPKIPCSAASLPVPMTGSTGSRSSFSSMSSAAAMLSYYRKDLYFLLKNPSIHPIDKGVMEAFRHRADNLIFKADELEQKVNEIVQFYTSKRQPNNSKGSSIMKDKDKEKSLGISDSTNIVNNSGSNGSAKKQVDGSQKEVICSKRMQELMRLFGTMLKQITQHKWAWLFMKPIEVEALGLHDYYEVIKKSMDFITIKNQMEAKDGSRYKNVREIYADVRLIFTNATSPSPLSPMPPPVAIAGAASPTDPWLEKKNCIGTPLSWSTSLMVYKIVVELGR